MNKINAVARSMMEDGGSVTYIVQLLEDPEDAKYNLKPELEEVKKTAADCRKECEEMKKKFEYWQSVILHLGQTTLDLKSKGLQMISMQH
jgi:predicted transcriptional regulator